MAVRNYSNTAVETALVGGINNSDTSCVVGSTSGFPASTPYTLIIDFEAATQEAVDVTAVAGTTLTITRGVDNTSAQAHSNGAVVVHAITKRDVSEPNAHINASTNEHGLAGGAAVVGTTSTQTLTNKTMSGASNTFSAIPGSAVDGTTFAKIVATAAAATDVPLTATGAPSQSANLFEVKNSGGTNQMALSSAANLNVVGRITANTDCVVLDQIIAGAAAVVAGEQLSVVVDDGNKGVVINNTGVGTGDALAIRDNGTDRIQVKKTGELVQSTGKFQLGSVAAVGAHKALIINDTATTDRALAVRGIASQSANVFEVENSTPTSLFAITAAGTATMGAFTALSGTIDAASDTTVLTVKGHSTQTAKLQSWTNDADAVKASVDNLGVIRREVPYVELTRATDQVISDSTTTNLSWTVETSDAHGFITVTGDTITVPAGYGGIYSLHCWARFDNNGTGFRAMFVEVNGVDIVEDRVPSALGVGASPATIQISTLLNLAAGDLIQLKVFQNSTGNLNIDSVIPPRLVMAML